MKKERGCWHIMSLSKTVLMQLSSFPSLRKLMTPLTICVKASLESPFNTRHTLEHALGGVHAVEEDVVPLPDVPHDVRELQLCSDRLPAPSAEDSAVEPRP